MLADNGANAGLAVSDLPALDGVDAIYLTGYAPLAPAFTSLVFWRWFARINSQGYSNRL